VVVLEVLQVKEEVEAMNLGAREEEVEVLQ
jgi:hypothetical protein